MSDTNANDTANKSQREELGALWKRQGKNQTYLTGYINKANGEKVKIVVFSSLLPMGDDSFTGKLS